MDSMKGTQIEINIRGKSLAISIVIEVSMVKIILFSNGEQYNPSSPERFNLKNFTFFKKLELMKEKIKEHHADLFLEYDRLLSDLTNFKDFRNKMAHCSFTWNDEEHFKIWDASDDFTYYIPFPTTVKETYIKIEEYLDLTRPIFDLEEEVKARLNRSHPLIYHQLTGGLSNYDEAKQS